MEDKRRTLKGVKGQYEILLPLARDRLSDYHLGVNLLAQGDDRFVVVREILPDLSAERERVGAFLSELRITSHFTHPNLVRTLETGRSKVSYFAIQEFLLGEGLGRVVAAAQATSVALPPGLAAGMLAQVCDGLEYAHQLKDAKGTPLVALHRALSPSRLVVGYAGRVKVLDFEVGEAAAPPPEGEGRAEPAYLAPEQVERLAPSPQTDVFSAAVVLWELLAGQSLFLRATDAETREAVRAARVPPIPAERQVPAELVAVVSRALARDPGKRFASASQLAQALRDFLRGNRQELGEYEVGAFVRSLLGDVEKRKRRLLEQAERAELSSGDITSLVPDRRTRFGWGPEQPGRPGSLSGSSRPRTAQDVPRLPPVPPQPNAAAVAPTSAVAPAAAGAPVEVSAVAPPRLFSETTQPVIRAAPADLWATAPARARRRQWPWLLAGAGAGLLVVAGLVVVYLTWARSARPAVPADGGLVVPTHSVLEIRSLPEGCQVQLDGRVLPRPTPLTGERVASGATHEVAVACPGHARQVQTVVGQPGELLVLVFRPARLP